VRRVKRHPTDRSILRSIGAHTCVGGDIADKLTDHLNSASYIIQHLSTNAQSQLNGFDEWIAFLSTPFKRLGISGWTQTGCSASGYGKPVRDAAWSTDQFFTIDVEVLTLAVASHAGTAIYLESSNRRYLRLEVEPGTSAHSTCERDRPKAGEIIGFKGVVLIDRDGPFYEVHPTNVWRYVP
jgi:hypothetical protein